MKKYYVFLAFFLVFGANFALAQGLPTGRVITLPDILNLAENFGGFLVSLAGILATIVVIVSGLMYLFAGSSPQRVASAKSIFKVGLIGAFIIFGVGMIISTVRSVANDPFQFFGGGNTGYTCNSDADCPGSSCNFAVDPPVCY